MPVKSIAAETQALLDAVVPPNDALTSSETDELYALVLPLHVLLAKAKARADAIELLRRRADSTEDSPEVFALFERIKQTNRALLGVCDDLARNFDRLTDTMYQFDRYGIDMQKSIDGREERLNKSAASAPVANAVIKP